jgi:hypothetical protein
MGNSIRVKFIESKGRQFSTDCLQDEDIDPLYYFTPHQNALRALLGDMRFVVNSKFPGSLFIALEFPNDPLLTKTAHIHSLLIISLDVNDIGEQYEVLLRVDGFNPISWADGMTRMNAIHDDDDAPSHDIIESLKEINRLVDPNITTAQARQIIGRPSGHRYEFQL